jgi:hypothetical protein
MSPLKHNPSELDSADESANGEVDPEFAAMCNVSQARGLSLNRTTTASTLHQSKTNG